MWCKRQLFYSQKSYVVDETDSKKYPSRKRERYESKATSKSLADKIFVVKSRLSAFHLLTNSTKKVEKRSVWRKKKHLFSTHVADKADSKRYLNG